MRGNIARLFFLFVLMLATAWIAGCSKTQTPKKKGGPSASKKAEPSEIIAEKAPYDPFSRWDSFRNPGGIGIYLAEKPEPDLDELMLEGTITGKGKEAAFILYPGGKKRIVKKHDKIGKYQGKVAEIGDCYIVVEENYIDPSNKNVTFKVQREMRIQDSKCNKARSK